jgi:GNAT superfamily N-acetyltransferase
MIQFTNLSSSEPQAVRDATHAERADRFPALDVSTAAFVLVTEPDAAVAVAPERFDSDALGVRIGRIVHASAPSVECFERLFAEVTRRAQYTGYEQVLRRTALSNLPEIWALEHSGFALMDVGVTFALRLTGPFDAPTYEGLGIRRSTDEDIARIVDVMVREPWGSRYESDPAYDAARVRELRSRWLWNSHRGRADCVLVGEIEGRPAGYVTCRVDRDSNDGEIELVGTLAEFRGRHVASRVIAHALSWFSTRTRLVTVRTQATNVAAARLYEGAGFTLHSSDLTFRLAVPRRDEGTA